MLKVLICDERPLISGALQQMLAEEPDLEIVGVADSGVHAMILMRSHHPDVVVSGPRLGGMSGTDLAVQLRDAATDSKPPLVLYGVPDTESGLDEALQAGVDGLCADDAGREELVLAIKAVAQGGAMLGPSIAHRLLSWFRQSEHPAVAEPGPLATSLTSRERQVLTLTAQGMSIDEIAEELFIGVATVRTHLYRVKSKLELRDRAALVAFVYQRGLMQESGDDAAD
ncbi:LuxR C-terminal-related transcriptional regulator [Streptomyces sp. NPDC092370]|uniref:LuxR C-terminal-related transcriptional regulator n=1 Tax=Streptomyces sp. NPDC092370 TaxID=3366016 RepID=UPI00381BF96E